MINSKGVDTPRTQDKLQVGENRQLDPIELKIFQRVVGSLIYIISAWMRYDLSSQVWRLVRKMSPATTTDFTSAKGVLRYL